MATPVLVDLGTLRRTPGQTAAFEGEAHQAPMSFFAVEMEPGGRVGLHRHPYVETWIVHEGAAEFTMGDVTQIVQPDLVIVVPAEVPHAFTSMGPARLRMTCIHASDRFITEWL